MARRVVVGHGFHQPQIAGKGVFNEVFAVAGDGGAPDDHPVAAPAVNLLQLLQHDGDGVALVGVVVGVKQSALRVDQRYFGGGGAGVDAQIGVSGIS
ncbi:hypothetical protein SDC9_102550 [bioreactor metagenome]|uniref:Uncharacterized protein n=1 Tax=bioreactor metagenome TaxID=1076179 RepID=A0A645AY10_9ZZZZ